MQTSIDLNFADGIYTFKLPLPLVNELQRKTGVGIGALFAKVLRGRYAPAGGASIGFPTEAEFAAADLLEPIRLGLIGGGSGVVNGEPVVVTAKLAVDLMEAYVYPARPLNEAWELAAAILMACVEGYREPDPKKKPDANGKTKRAETAGSIIQ